MKTFAIYTLGCKVNIYESEIIKKSFLKDGYQEVNHEEIADVYVINTCTVTNNSDSKSRKIIRKLVKQNKNALVCVVGCYSQVAPQDVAAIEGVDIVLGSKFKDQLPELVKKYDGQKVMVTDIFDSNNKAEDMMLESYSNNTRAFIKIQDGCNNFCTFCIIPFARGKILSKPPKDVIEEIKTMVQSGHKEVVLTGIHTGGYGIDLKDYSLLKLLKDIKKELPDFNRLRISSIEITQLDKETIDFIANGDLVVNHLHVPIQSGSDKVLKDMHRKYDLKSYLAKLEELRNAIPDINITTDIIIGFPTETDEDFEQTLETIKEAKFGDMHIFPYSARNNTPAGRMKQLNGKVIEKRIKQVTRLKEILAKEFIESNLDKEHEVIVEKNGTGYTRNYIKVKLDDYEVGELKTIKLNKKNYLL